MKAAVEEVSRIGNSSEAYLALEQRIDDLQRYVIERIREITPRHASINEADIESVLGHVAATYPDAILLSPTQILIPRLPVETFTYLCRRIHVLRIFVWRKALWLAEERATEQSDPSHPAVVTTEDVEKAWATYMRDSYIRKEILTPSLQQHA